MDEKKFTVKTCLLSVILSIMFIGCKSGPELAKKRFFRMDTITDITLVVHDEKEAQPYWNSIDSLLKYWEDHFSVEGPISEILALNERQSAVMPAGWQLIDMLQTGLNYSDTLDGGFDLTVLPLKQLWGLGENSKADTTVPSEQQVKSALDKVDYRNIRLVNDSVSFMSKETRIDVGGIAKGYVLREIGKMLDSHGIKNYLVSAGGDIIVKGKRIDGNPWRVGIQHPRDQGIIGTIDIDSGSIVTSGDYERFRIVDGKRYHHIFDTKTGYSSNKNQSLTIWGPDPVEADIMSTGLFSRNTQEILQFINARPRLECMVVDSTGKVFLSSNWKGKVTVVDKR